MKLRCYFFGHDWVIVETTHLQRPSDFHVECRRCQKRQEISYTPIIRKRGT